jgi:hypothetical protein
MLGLKLEMIDACDAEPLQGEHFLGTIHFSGKVVGQVYLRMSMASARAIAAGILGLSADELIEFDLHAAVCNHQQLPLTCNVKQHFQKL